MIDNYAKVSILIRGITAFILILILIKQIKLLSRNIRDQWIKYVLMTLVMLVLANTLWSLFINFYRGDDGNLVQKARHYSLIFNSMSGLLSAIGWAILYKNDSQE